MSSYIGDLESNLDRVGRQKAFDLARANGWTNSTPPVFVWWQIVAELEESHNATPTQHETAKDAEKPHETDM